MAEELLTPEEAASAQAVSAQTAALADSAAAAPVRSQAEAEAAAELLGSIEQARREAENTRRFLVKPLNDHVKAINARFKPTTEALDAASQLVRGKITAFRQLQERQRVEAERELAAQRAAAEREADEQRRREVAAAQAQREAAAREAERARVQAERAERERLAAMERDTHDRRARIAKLGDDALKRIADGGSRDSSMAVDELAVRQRAREAQEAAARAQEAENQARAAEAAAREAPLLETPSVVVEAPAPLRSASARIAERKRWTFEVVDAAKVPDRFKVVDDKAIRQAVKDGERQIAGVRIFQTDELAVRGAR
jgi:hypothetical protein